MWQKFTLHVSWSQKRHPASGRTTKSNGFTSFSPKHTFKSRLTLYFIQCIYQSSYWFSCLPLDLINFALMLWLKIWTLRLNSCLAYIHRQYGVVGLLRLKTNECFLFYIDRCSQTAIQTHTIPRIRTVSLSN